MDPFSRHGRAAAGGRLEAHACWCMNREVGDGLPRKRRAGNGWKRKPERGRGCRGTTGDRGKGSRQIFYGENLESRGLLLERYFHRYEFYRLVDRFWLLIIPPYISPMYAWCLVCMSFSIVMAIFALGSQLYEPFSASTSSSSILVHGSHANMTTFSIPISY